MDVVPDAAIPTSLSPGVAMEHGPQLPSSIPIVPPLRLARTAFGSTDRHRDPDTPDLRPWGEDGFRKHDGRMCYNHIITTGVWWLLTGDRPCMALCSIPGTSAYASPAVLPGTGVGGRLRVAIRAGGNSAWLDRFPSIEARYAPGSTSWRCTNEGMGVVCELRAVPTVETFGFVASLEILVGPPGDVEVSWVFGGVGYAPDVHWSFDESTPVRAFNKLGEGRDELELRGDSARLTSGAFGYTEVLVALAGEGARSGSCSTAALDPAADLAVPDGGSGAGSAEEPCVLLTSTARRADFVCVWGYTGFDKDEVGKAYRRLEYRPFADPRWVEEMKPRWFHHWVGRGLSADEKLRAVLADTTAAVREADSFWAVQRKRMRIRTPDASFDCVANSTAALMRMQYEYPGILHGLTYNKYGKINCGYYGFDAAGYHAEVAESLKLISGTQCIKGRHRYFTPAFSLSPWAEEVNFYYVEQVWYHYRWTGDLEFLRTMWPSVRRALEHALGSSDPDGDGIRTGYYEMWNSDTLARGGRCALHTGMAWAALRAAAEMAGVLGDTDRSNEFMSGSVQGPYPPEYRERYDRYRRKVEEQFQRQLWSKDRGAWCSGEWSGELRPHPATHEQSYHIWRGLGGILENYCALRYVRENLHMRLGTGHTVELHNAWWPVLWSHHYVADGDVCTSFQSACAAGDVDSFWPLFRSIADTAYTGHDGALYHCTGSHTQEIDCVFVHAIIDGMFGIKPDFGENRVVIRPSLPAEWGSARIELADVSYTLEKDPGRLSLEVTTPVERVMVVELPVRCALRSVRVDGGEAAYSLEPGVNGCRVRVEAPPGRRHVFTVELDGAVPVVDGSARLTVGEAASFLARHCRVGQVLNPQGKRLDAVVRAEGDMDEVVLTPRETGLYTVFLQLQCGGLTWLYPLELDVRCPWTLVRSCTPTDGRESPRVSSPAFHRKRGVLTLEVRNNLRTEVRETAEITVAGTTFRRALTLPADSVTPVVLDLGDARRRVSPGSIPVMIGMGGRVETAEAVCWEADEELDGSMARWRQLDLGPWYTASLRKLYSPEFAWRVDYTGCGVGVDWRDPMPPRDERGWVLMSPPIGQLEYGVLPEQWKCTGYWDAPAIGSTFGTPPGIPFRTAGPAAAEDILALAATAPYGQLPGRVVLSLPGAPRLEKVYLLTANLTKTLKCYYPGAEITVRYVDSTQQVLPLIPPYTMSCLAQDFCPTALAIPFGRIEGGCDPLQFGADPRQAYVSLSDLVLDATRGVKEIELRCVASETILGVLGITVLEAARQEAV